MWPDAPDAPRSPKEDRVPVLMKSKKYENVQSRLFNPTVASTTKFSPDIADEEPKEAFGHPIEPQYRKLVRKGRKSTSPTGRKSPRSPIRPSGSGASPKTSTPVEPAIVCEDEGSVASTPVENEETNADSVRSNGIARSETLEL